MPYIEYDVTEGRARATEENEGTICRAEHCGGNCLIDYGERFPDFDEPVICIQYRGRFCWAALTTLSGTLLSRYICNIDGLLKTSLVPIAVPLPQEDREIAFLRNLYERYTDEQRKKFMEDGAWKNSPLEKYICGRANNSSPCLDLMEQPNKCIHVDCPGCCDKCKPHQFFMTVDGLHCCACDKKQVKICPICLEEKNAAELCVLGCHHSFCWRCYGLGCMKGEQITKCPECRVEIVEVKEIMI